MSDSLQPHGLQPTRVLGHGILQARLLEWVASSSSRESSQPRDQTRASYISCTGKQALYQCDTWEVHGKAKTEEKARGVRITAVIKGSWSPLHISDFTKSDNESEQLL